MLKFLALTLLVVASASAGPSIIAKSPRLEPFLGRAVENPRSCGGQGKVEEVRITDLVTGASCGPQPCVLTPDNAHNFEFDFTAGHNSDVLNLVCHARLFGIPFEIVNTEYDMNTQPGLPFTISMTVTVTSDLSGSNFVLVCNVYGRPGNGHHICGETDCRVS